MAARARRRRGAGDNQTMGQATRAEIITTTGAFPLLGSAPIRWPFTEGTEPSVGVFDIIPAFAEQILAGDSQAPVILRLEANSIVQNIQGLWVENLRPGPNPFIRQIMLADRRRFLRYGMVVGRYNIKRQIGTRRVSSNLEPVLQAVVPDVWYAAYSLKDPTAFPASPSLKWKPLDMLRDVMEKALVTEAEHTGTSPSLLMQTVQFTPEVASLDDNQAVEDVEIIDKAQIAVARAMAYFAEVGLTVDTDGNYVFFSRVSGQEFGIRAQLGPEIANMGHAEVVDNRHTAPRAVEVYWPIEAEVRFDYVEQADVIEDSEAIPDARDLLNVAPVPDFSLVVDGETVAQGTYRNLYDLRKAWGTPPGIGGQFIGIRTIRRAIAGYIDLFAGLRLSGAVGPDADWASRITAIQDHFRLTFKMPPRWIDRALSMRPYRVGVADIATQTRASSEAYCDYYKMHSLRSMFKNKAQGQGLAFATNVAGGPQGAGVEWPTRYAVRKFDGNEFPIPARVDMLDADQGVFHLSFRPDMFRVYELLGPGNIDPAVTGDWRDGVTSMAMFDTIFEGDQIPELKAAFALATILTLVPGSPNGLGQFYKITVEPNDVQDYLPPAAANWLAKVAGPVWQTHVMPGRGGATAMVRWLDDRWEDTERLFGVREGAPNLDGLVVNRNVDTINPERGLIAANLDTMSRSIAARVWARFADRLQGAHTGHLNPAVQLRGWASSLSASVDPRGVATTQAMFPDAIPELPFASLLDSGTRALLYREIQPRAAV